ncbi:MAG: hypothetical protein O7I93_13975 [Gemmatimonadetes bacterium]|nr:hypothetical protein [Gemmatimonadota bacterium]
MLEIRGDLDLVQERLGTDDGSEFRTQHLHRHLPAVFEILGEVDRGHATGAQLALDGVAVGQGRREPVDDIRHGRLR